MKKRRKEIILWILLLMLSCSNNIEENNDVDMTNIEFSDYNLDTTICQWKNRDKGKVLIINSESELKKYLECSGVVSSINFSKHTLLLASGSTTSGIQEIRKNLIQKSDNIFELEITINLAITGVIENWNLSILSFPKIKQGSTVILNVKYINQGR
jgi:hypothetical protein